MSALERRRDMLLFVAELAETIFLDKALDHGVAELAFLAETDVQFAESTANQVLAGEGQVFAGFDVADETEVGAGRLDGEALFETRLFERLWLVDRQEHVRRVNGLVERLLVVGVLII